MKNESTMLKISSIILLVFGTITAVMLVLAIGGISMIGALGGTTGALIAGSIAFLLSIFSVIMVVLEISAAVFGIKTAGGNGNPALCKTLGTILLVIEIAGAAIELFTGQLDGSTLLSTAVNLALIICYLKGASDMC